MPAAIQFIFDPIHKEKIGMYLYKKSYGVFDETVYTWCQAFKDEDFYRNVLNIYTQQTSRALSIERLDELLGRAANFPHGVLAPDIEIRDEIIGLVNKKYLYGGNGFHYDDIGPEKEKVTNIVRHYLMSNLFYGDIIQSPFVIHEENRKPECYLAQALQVYSNFHPFSSKCLTQKKDQALARIILDQVAHTDITQLSDLFTILEHLLPSAILQNAILESPSLPPLYFTSASTRDKVIMETVNGPFKEQCLHAAKIYYNLDTNLRPQK